MNATRHGTNSCGSCPHRFSFALGAADPVGAATTVRLSVRSCTGDTCPSSGRTFVLPINSATSGAVCSAYASFDSLQQPVVGRLNTPPHEDSTCDTDLVATEVSIDGLPQTRCVAACSTTVPCPLPDELTCQAGLCFFPT